MKKIGFVCLLLLTVGIFTSVASADSVTYALTIGNNSGSTQLGAYAGPFGDVKVTWVDATHAKVTFTAAADFAFTHTSAADVNVNATSFTISNITGVSAPFASHAPSLSQGSAGAVDGFGKFNGVIDSFDSFSYSTTSISFDITNSSGSWANAAAVLIDNKDGHAVAAGMGACGSAPTSAACTSSTTAFVLTGFATGPLITPEPASLLLLGSGLFSLGLLRRRK